MGVGEAATALQEINDGQSVDAQPGTGTVWSVHNVYHSNDVALIFTGGTANVTADTSTGSGMYSKYAWEVTDSHFLRIVNTSGTPATYGFSGVVINVP